MVRNPTSEEEGGSSRAIRIRGIVTQCMLQDEAGLSVDDDEIFRQHPDLLPELREALRKARLIHALASNPSSSTPNDSNGRKRDLKREQRLLEEALDGYRIVGRIDHGGQGAVFQGVQEATNRHVAIKMLLDGPLASETQLRRFEQEVRLICRLRHPNIVTIYDSGVASGRPYFVMEYVDGVPIDDYTLFHMPSVQDCVRLFVRVCRALGYAHQRGIIHRDVKPGNILVDMGGEPKLLDFGLAKALGDDPEFGRELSITTPGRVLGTLAFMSPEQVNEVDGEIDVRTDIYSLGVVLYKLLTGAYPYPVNVGTAKVYRNIVERDAVSLRKAVRAGAEDGRYTNGEISDDLDRIVLKALAKDKERRYQSTLALADDLDRYLAGDAVEAKADSGYYILKKTLRRYRLQAVSAAAVLGVLILASVLVTRQWLVARAERETARKATIVAQASLDDVVGEVIESVGTLAGASAIQDRLLNAVRERYRELVPLLQSDETMASIEARIYERLGDMAAKEGHHVEASEKFQTCLQMRESLTSGEGIGPRQEIDKLRVLRKLAEVSADRSTDFERALACGETLVSRRPDDFDAAFELCATRIGYARHLFRSGEYAAAIAHAVPTIPVARRAVEGRPNEAAWSTLLAEAYQWEGSGRIKLGEAEEGLAALAESLRLHESLAERTPANVHLRHGLLEANMRLGTACRDVGRVDEARVLFEKAIAAGDYLTGSDPHVADWKHALLLAYDRMIALLIWSKQLEEAKAYADRAVVLAGDLVQAERGNVEWQRSLAFARSNRGEVLYEQRNWEEACSEFVETLRIRKKLQSAEPTSESHLAELAAAYDWLARCETRLGHAERARANHLASIELRSALAEAHPEVMKHAMSLAAAQINLSAWHIRQQTPKDDAAAAALLGEAEITLAAARGKGAAISLQDQYNYCLRMLERNTRMIRKRADRRASN